MVIVRRKGIIYAPTSVQIPEDVRDIAKSYKICLSGTLTEALIKKIHEYEIEEMKNKRER